MNQSSKQRRYNPWYAAHTELWLKKLLFLPLSSLTSDWSHTPPHAASSPGLRTLQTRFSATSCGHTAWEENSLKCFYIKGKVTYFTNTRHTESPQLDYWSMPSSASCKHLLLTSTEKFNWRGKLDVPQYSISDANSCLFSPIRIHGSRRLSHFSNKNASKWVLTLVNLENKARGQPASLCTIPQWLNQSISTWGRSQEENQIIMFQLYTDRFANRERGHGIWNGVLLSQ